MNTNTNFNRNIDEDLYSTIYIDNLLANTNDWRNIQEIVRVTIKSLTDVVKSQGIAIKELEKQVNTKASRNDLISGLGSKANVNDVMRTFNEVAANIENRPTVEELQLLMDEKISKSEINYILNSKPSMEEVRNLINQRVESMDFKETLENEFKLRLEDVNMTVNKKLQHVVTQKDLQGVFSLLDSKANLQDINEALANKASKESVISALQRKMNKSEVEAIINSKVDSQDFQNLLNMVKNKAEYSDIERLSSVIDGKTDRAEFLQMSSMLSNKIDIRDYDILQNSMLELRSEMQGKTRDLDNDIDRLIENIKKEFHNLNQICSGLEQSKIDVKDFDKLVLTVNKKADFENFNNMLSQFKLDILDNFNAFKNDSNLQSKSMDDKVNEKLNLVEKQNNYFMDDLMMKLNKLNEENKKMNDLVNDTQLKVKASLANQSKDVLNDINYLKDEILRVSGELEDILTLKADKKDLDSLNNKISNDFDKKVTSNQLENLYKTVLKDINDKIEDCKSVNNKAIKLFENDIFKILDKKANQFDVTNSLNNKADLGVTSVALQSKASNADLDKIRAAVEKLIKDINVKLDNTKFESFVKESRKTNEDINKELLNKAAVKEVLSLLKNKPDIEDVNKALSHVHEELDTKSNLEQFKQAMDNQSLINDALCSENCTGRWAWKTGVVKNGYAIPWEIQLVNTAPDNYLWEKDKTSVTVVAAGLYELNMAFFADKKPTVQLLVNGEPVLSAVNSSSYVVHHSSGRLKNIGKHTYGNITGKK